MVFNSLVPDQRNITVILNVCFPHVFEGVISEARPMTLSWNKRHHTPRWWWINFGSGNGLVPSGHQAVAWADIDQAS